MDWKRLVSDVLRIPSCWKSLDSWLWGLMLRKVGLGWVCRGSADSARELQKQSVEGIERGQLCHSTADGGSHYPYRKRPILTPNSFDSVIKAAAGKWCQSQSVVNWEIYRKGAYMSETLVLAGKNPSSVLGLSITTTRWCSPLSHLVFPSSRQVRWFVLCLPCRTTSTEGPADPPLAGREGDDFPGYDWMQHSLACGLLPNAQPKSPLPLQHRGSSQRRTTDEKCNKRR